ncbi:hypothetical protein H2201_003422 [Coniosporium apollinis]|uniref:Glutamine synthetase n=1 Tax=Coniosporium apollinis TaxID=61459 RepID=A0ABQ9NYY4_9PEZI|nr:hypothetical protein H2201_003422 [Coniosporium apollinis]
MAGTRSASLDDLRSVIRNCPVIDNHAHNLLLSSQLDAYPFESITTEAQAPALKDTFTSLSHIRAAKQLRELYGCGADEDWDHILEKRADWLEHRRDELHRKCLEGIQSILIDDGLGSAEDVHPYEWHSQYTVSPCKRIVRIETVAETLLEEILENTTEDDIASEEYMAGTWVVFTEAFESEILRALHNPEVVGFKSVICYRTGLNIEPDYEECVLKVGPSFGHYVARCVERQNYRISRKALNDFLVLQTLEIISVRAADNDSLSKPIQFHTGLGDADLKLVRSNPAEMQGLIEQYPLVPFVLLHSSYPYTREAGYLATVYMNVYLDLGEVFPMLSKDGQTSILRQALELSPYSKLLFSTDGHFFPETYWLATKQFREALEEVAVEYVEKNALTLPQAIELGKAILFTNSNILYDLDLSLTIPSSDVAPDQQSLTHNPKPNPSSSVNSTSSLDTFIQNYPSTRYVYLQWLDYMGTLRARILPIAEFTRIVQSGSGIGISRGNTGTLQNDTVTPAVNTTGQLYVEPDLFTLRKTHTKDPLPSASVMGFWRDEDGKAIKECPRGGLQLLLDELETEHNISLVIGFEIEVTFLRRADPSSPPTDRYKPLTANHAWGTLTPEQVYDALPLLAEITEALLDISIEVQQFHAESGPGQYEFVLPPLPGLEAIDTLIQARQVVHQIAHTHGLRATLHPMPLPGVGTAAHAHVSLNSVDRKAVSESKEMAFWVNGVLKHLEAICAFSLPEEVSYQRVIDDSWTGGTWVAWGTQNREVPLRRVQPGRWELRCIDGMANMYLALAAVIGAGLLGLRAGEGAELSAKDCPHNPSKLSDDQRKEYGIERRMPKSIEEALDALEKDEELKHMLAESLVEDYISMKRVEQKMLADMEEGERKTWLIERY